MISFVLLVEVLARGLAMGVVYALMGLGLTLIFGVMRTTNFAQGEFYMLGGYVIYYLITLFKLPFFISILGGMLLLFWFGVIVEKLLLSPVSRNQVENPMEYSMIITFALSILLQKVAVILFGPNYLAIPDFISGNLKIGFLSIPNNLILAALVAVILITFVTAFIQYTWRGRSWRAIAQSRNGASILGVKIDFENSLVFGLSAALAAAAGAILSPITLIFPSVGSTPLIKGYEILAIGGLGSIPGSLVGGLMLGIVEALGSVVLASAYKDFYGFALLALFLLFRPRGLFGQA